jgi:hypothetical protein
MSCTPYTPRHSAGQQLQPTARQPAKAARATHRRGRCRRTARVPHTSRRGPRCKACRWRRPSQQRVAALVAVPVVGLARAPWQGGPASAALGDAQPHSGAVQLAGAAGHRGQLRRQRGGGGRGGAGSTGRGHLRTRRGAIDALVFRAIMAAAPITNAHAPAGAPTPALATTERAASSSAGPGLVALAPCCWRQKSAATAWLRAWSAWSTSLVVPAQVEVAEEEGLPEGLLPARGRGEGSR